jgi:hypothetical protein
MPAWIGGADPVSVADAGALGTGRAGRFVKCRQMYGGDRGKAGNQAKPILVEGCFKQATGYYPSAYRSTRRAMTGSPTRTTIERCHCRNVRPVSRDRLDHRRLCFRVLYSGSLASYLSAAGLSSLAAIPPLSCCNPE